MTYFSKTCTLVAFATCLALSASTAHATSMIGLQLEGGGSMPSVFALNNGNFLSLWGFDTREGAMPGNMAPVTVSEADLAMGFTSGSVVGFYYGSNAAFNAGASEFDPLVFDVTVADDTRFFDSLWVEWEGGNLVYERPNGGTSTIGAVPTLIGDPLNTIPEPSTLALIGIFAAMAAALRLRK